MRRQLLKSLVQQRGSGRATNDPDAVPDDAAAFITEVAPYIYVGNLPGAMNQAMLSACRIARVVTVASADVLKRRRDDSGSTPTEAVEPSPSTVAVGYYFIRLEDNKHGNVIEAFEAARPLIEECVQREVNILVHCIQGRSRSVAVVATYLMVAWPPVHGRAIEAIEWVRRVQPSADPNPVFRMQLVKLEKQLAEQRRSIITQLSQLTTDFANGLSYNVYADGAVLVQQCSHRISDVTHERWTELPTEFGNTADSELYHRTPERIAVSTVVLCGDKASGKTTFCHALCTPSVGLLQCFRYESSDFRNVWYDVTADELGMFHSEVVEGRTRGLPFFPSQLCYGNVVMEPAELNFFLTDEELVSEQQEGHHTMDEGKSHLDRQFNTSSVLPEDLQHAVVRVVEVGGDLLQAVMRHRRNPSTTHDDDSFRSALYNAVSMQLAQAGKAAYFVNAVPFSASYSVERNAALLADICRRLSFVADAVGGGGRENSSCLSSPPRRCDVG